MFFRRQSRQPKMDPEKRVVADYRMRSHPLAEPPRWAPDGLQHSGFRGGSQACSGSGRSALRPVQVAADDAVRGEAGLAGVDLAAEGHGVAAAGVEVAARRRGGGRGDVARQADALAAGARTWSRRPAC